MSTKSERQALWDRLGYWASSACALHCLATPLLFLALPAFAKIWAHPASHVLMAIAVVPLALTVIVHGYRQHRRRWVLGAALLGIACILGGSVLPYLPGSAPVSAPASAHSCENCCPSVITDSSGDSWMHIPAAALVTILGSMALVAAHLGNRRGCRTCQRLDSLVHGRGPPMPQR